jgi:hypothetical protein
MIHDIVSVIERLVVYADELRNDWTYKRGDIGAQRQEYEALRETIKVAGNLVSRLESIDRMNTGDMAVKK